MLIFFFDMQNISATFVTGLGLKIDAAIPGGVSFLREVSLLVYWVIGLFVYLGYWVTPHSFQVFTIFIAAFNFQCNMLNVHVCEAMFKIVFYFLCIGKRSFCVDHNVCS